MKEENTSTWMVRDVLCRSILGAEIPYYTLGTGKRAVLYVGGVRGDEGALGAVLEAFVGQVNLLAMRGGSAFERPVRELLASRRLVVVPCLNPDGISYRETGVAAENPIADRVRAILGEASLAEWRANARGVALDKNFNSGHASAVKGAWAACVYGAHPALWCGEYPESEPESAALARLARGIGEDLLGVLEFSFGGEEIRCSCAEKLSAKTLGAGRILARATGLPLTTPTQTPASGGFFDWCLDELSRPAYRVCIKPPAHTAPARIADVVYERLAKALFTFPFMV